MEEATSELQEHEMKAEHSEQTESHAAEAQGHEGGGDPFQELLGGLGDHHELTLFNVQVTGLPVIVYDKESGFHYFSSIHSMAENPQSEYAYSHHARKIEKKSNPEASVLDLSVTNFVVFEWAAMLIALILFYIAGKRAKKNPNGAPKGVHNLVETLVVFLRDDVIYPNIGGKKIGDRLLPYFIGLFFFILFMNLLGLVPGGHTATSSISITAALAITAYLVINITAIKEIGIGAYLKHLLGGAPIWLAPIMIPIEIISMFVKPFALTIRLMANMTAGHVVLLSLVGIIFYFAKMGMPTGAVIGGIGFVSVAFSVFMYCLELLVAFLQAYIFTILTAVFTGLAVGDHGHEEQATEH